MERDPQFRYTTITLLVEWDPVQHDHPLGWPWSTELGVNIEAIEFQDEEKQ